MLAGSIHLLLYHSRDFRHPRSLPPLQPHQLHQAVRPLLLPSQLQLPTSSLFNRMLLNTEMLETAISALPNDGAEKVILINPGTNTEQININRTGKVTLRGVTSFENDYSQNQVTIQFSYGVSTSAWQDESTPVINSKKTDGSGLALYNINFVNTFPQTKNYAALATDFYVFIQFSLISGSSANCLHRARTWLLMDARSSVSKTSCSQTREHSYFRTATLKAVSTLSGASRRPTSISAS